MDHAIFLGYFLNTVVCKFNKTSILYSKCNSNKTSTLYRKCNSTKLQHCTVNAIQKKFNLQKMGEKIKCSLFSTLLLQLSLFLLIISLSTCLSYFNIGKKAMMTYIILLHVFVSLRETSYSSSQLQDCNFIKKEILAHVFSCEFCEISKNSFFTEHLWWLLLMLITIIRFGRYRILLASNCTFMSDSHY